MAIQNAFTQLVKVQDEASKSLEAITQRAENVHKAAIKASGSLRGLGDSMLKPLGEKVQRDPVSGRFASADRSAVDMYGEALEKMSQSGAVTTGQLRRMALQMEIMSEDALPKAKERLLEVSKEVRKVGLDMEIAGQQTGKTMNRFQFMGDVGDDMAKSMRMVSAASQGMMLGMSLLQKNFIGIGFSLIFLQFSGFLKLSVLMAATTLVVGVATEAFKKYFKEVKRIKELKQAMSFITGSETAGDIVVDRSKQIVKDLGIEGEAGEKLTKGLQQAMVELNFRGIEPTAEALRVFAQTMAIEMQIRGKSAEEALTSAMNSMLGFTRELQEGTHQDTVSIDGVIMKMDEFDRLGGNALASISLAMSQTAKDFKQDAMDMSGSLFAAGESMLETGARIQATQRDAQGAFEESGRGAKHTEAVIADAFSGLPSAAGVVVDSAETIIEQFIAIAVAADTATGSVQKLAAVQSAIPGEFFLSSRPGGVLTAAEEDALIAARAAGVVVNAEGLADRIAAGGVFFPGQGDAEHALADRGPELLGPHVIHGSATATTRPGVEVIINGTIITEEEIGDAVQVTIGNDVVDGVRLSAFTGFNSPIA